VNYDIHKKRVKAFNFFFENVKDFKLNYYITKNNFSLTFFLRIYADSEFKIKFYEYESLIGRERRG